MLHVLKPSQGPQKAWGTPAALCCLWRVALGTVLPGGRAELPTPTCSAKATPQTMPTMEHGNVLHCFEVQFMQKTTFGK